MQSSSDRPEQINEMLDPHRREERAGAAVEVSGRLFQKGIEVSSDEDPAELADLLSAVERFEQAVINRGGDLMVNMPTSSDPQLSKISHTGRHRIPILYEREATAPAPAHSPG